MAWVALDAGLIGYAKARMCHHQCMHPDARASGCDGKFNAANARKSLHAMALRPKGLIGCGSKRSFDAALMQPSNWVNRKNSVRNSGFPLAMAHSTLAPLH